ncbi:MAG: hypothetical protein J6N15_05195 [Ruminiclostridium sp.]|nr:hypothetical protein [Ruminiclostridium sp.]
MLLKIALGSGYDVTLEELIEAEKENRKAKAAQTDAKLSIDELEDVAGGKAWNGEDAPDGHELGCLIFYHHSGYSKENEVWCKDNYYCSGTNRTCAYFDKTCARDVY